jgi:hypothetical protein
MRERWGLAGFVLKNRTYCTQPLALLVQRLVPEVRVFGCLVLDGEVGGLNYRAVKSAAEIGTKVLYMPVFYPLTRCRWCSAAVQPDDLVAM